MDCKDQEEIDYYRDRLVEDGEESMCGWLKDKYGLSMSETLSPNCEVRIISGFRTSQFTVRT